MLISMGCYSNVEKTGQTSEKCDIKVTFYDGTVKSIQVKTLSRSTCPDTYYMRNGKVYEPNMIIIMVNKERTRFAYEFAGNIKTKNLTLYFASENTKYENIMFRDLNLFKQRLYQMIPYSSDYKKIITSDAILKEDAMLTRLEQFCFFRGLSYRRNDTNGDQIDCYIKGFAYQAKYVSFPKDSDRCTYSVSFHKSGGEMNGKRLTQPYNINDNFDWVVVEVGGIFTGTEEDKTKYHGRFCSIPKFELIKQDILKSDTCKGKTAFSICPPDYQRDHWSKQYWVN